LDLDDLPSELAEPGAVTSAAPGEPPGDHSLASLIGKSLLEMEKTFIAETLRATGGNREEAAALLGIGSRTLYRKLKEFESPAAEPTTSLDQESPTPDN